MKKNGIIMKMITKTPRKIILKVNFDQINSQGFDQVWDNVRDNYPIENYDIHDIVLDNDYDDNNLFIEFNKINEEEKELNF